MLPILVLEIKPRAPVFGHVPANGTLAHLAYFNDPHEVKPEKEARVHISSIHGKSTRDKATRGAPNRK